MSPNLRTLTLILALLVAMTAPPAHAKDSASATLDAVLHAPLRSQDPVAPIQVIASTWWVVPGQTSKSTALWLWAAGGALVLAGLLWRLNRR